MSLLSLTSLSVDLFMLVRVPPTRAKYQATFVLLTANMHHRVKANPLSGQIELEVSFHVLNTHIHEHLPIPTK